MFQRACCFCFALWLVLSPMYAWEQHLAARALKEIIVPAGDSSQWLVDEVEDKLLIEADIRLSQLTCESIRRLLRYPGEGALVAPSPPRTDFGFHLVGMMINPGVYLASVKASASGKRMTISKEDAASVARVYNCLVCPNRTEFAELSTEVCSEYAVGCAHGQVVALLLGGRHCSPSVLSHIHAFPLKSLSLGVLPTSAYKGLVFEHLETLWIDCESLGCFEFASRQLQLRSLTLELSAKKRKTIRRGMGQLCSLTRLLRLHIKTGTGLNLRSNDIPTCWNAFIHLVSLDLRAQELSVLPVHIHFPNLVSFVAFGQGLGTRVAGDDCRRTIEALGEGFDTFICKSRSLSANVSTLLDLQMPKLEKLWVDTNFLFGPIPDLVEAFPRLRSLDLNDNNLQGTIPAQLSRLPFHQLQLMGNNITGEVPPGLWKIKTLNHLRVGLNPHLRGCLPPSAVVCALNRPPCQAISSITGTQIAHCTVRSEL